MTTATRVSVVLSEAEIKHFSEEGAVCLRQVISEQWIDRLRCGVKANLAETPHGPHFRDLGGDGTAFTDMWRWNVIRDYEQAARFSEAASIAGQLLEAQEITLIEEQMFYKKPGSCVSTPWHHDLPYYPLTGRMCVVWIPLNEHSAADSLKIVRRSHRMRRQFVPRDFRASTGNRPLGDADHLPPGVEVLDITALEREGYEVISWHMAPGDALAFDALTVHGNSGNGSTQVASRVALRYAAEDVRYVPRKYPWVFTQWPFADQVEGSRLGGAMFPVVWTSGCGKA